MKLNRRNVLVGLGGIVASGGALLGTGAFSTVEADRTVTVETANDASSLVGFDHTKSSYASLNNGTLELTLNEVNLDATTTINGVFDIVNNHDAGITLDSTPWTAMDSGIEVELSPTNESLDPGATTAVDLTIITDEADEGASFSTSITIEAST